MAEATATSFNPAPAPTTAYLPVARTLVNQASLIVSLMFLLSVLGYPVVGVLASFYVFDDNTLAIIFRSGVVALALYGVGLALFRTPPRLLVVPAALLLIFLLYSVRLIQDGMSGRFPDILISAGYFFGTCFIPALPAFLLARFYDARRDAPRFLIVGIGICVAILVMQLLGITGFTDESQESEGRFSLGRLNSITIGHVACTTIIAAIAVYFEPWHNLRWRFVAMAAVPIALGCVAVAASRGPLASLVVAIMALLVFQRRWKSLAAVSVVAVAAIINFTDYQSSLIDRLLTIGSDQSSLERLNLLASATEQFVASPIFGSAHVELISGFYPHNILVDAAMSMGILGLSLMIWLHIRGVLGVARRMSAGELLLPLVVVQYLAGAQFSGAVTNSHEFWIPLSIIIAVSLGASGSERSNRPSSRMNGPMASNSRPRRPDNG